MGDVIGQMGIAASLIVVLQAAGTATHPVKVRRKNPINASKHPTKSLSASLS